ncbi:hypothetical protein, partial [Peribacillus simplex]|uniref:hypothetical protein n=1 Tax=Peribacillus simplex TaxID=1478 RepID=UPI003D2CC5C1
GYEILRISEHSRDIRIKLREFNKSDIITLKFILSAFISNKKFKTDEWNFLIFISQYKLFQRVKIIFYVKYQKPIFI